MRGEWERAEQQRGCVDALTEDMLMQTSGAVALTLLTVLYWCVCVVVCWACGDDHDDGNVIMATGDTVADGCVACCRTTRWLGGRRE